MPPKKKGSKGGVSDRPRDQQSLFVAFAKQIKLIKCPVCSGEFAAGVIAAHKRGCTVRDDDEECQVLFSQTAEQKWAAGLITLDGDENKVKREKTTPTPNDRVARTPLDRQSTTSLLQRRRGAKRRIEGGESGGDDSDFAVGSQDDKETEKSRRGEPVRTRRSERVTLLADVSMLSAVDEMGVATGGEESAADATMREGEEAAAAADATMQEDDWATEFPAAEDASMGEEEAVAAPVGRAADAAPPRRVTRSTNASSQDNQDPSDLGSPFYPASQGSSMEVEIGIEDTPSPREVDERQRTRTRRRRKEEEERKEVNVDEVEEEELCATPPPPEIEEKRRTTRREMREKESTQATDNVTTRRKGGEDRKKEKEDEKRKKKEEEESRKKREKEEIERKREEREAENRKKKEEKEKKRKEEEKMREEEKKKEGPIEGMTKILLRALEDKCVRHEKGLVPSQELVQAAVITLEEEDPQVVPHYVYLLCKIIRRVLSTRTASGSAHDETFWGEDLRMVSRFLSLKDDAKLLFIRLFTRKRGWHLPEKLKEKYSYLHDRVDGALVELMKDGFLENGKSALSSSEETLRLCSLDKLRAIAKDFRVDSNKPKPALITSLLQSATTQRQLFTTGTPGNNGRLLVVAKKHLGPVYRTSEMANLFFRAVFSLYSPALTDSHLVAEDRTINIISHMMFRMKEIHYEQISRRAPFPCERIIGVYGNKEELYEFVGAKEAEERLLRALDRHDVDGAMEEAHRAREKLTKMDTQRMSSLRSLPIHHLPYTTEGVLTRIVSRGVDCLERKKDYAAACNWIKFIIRSEVLPSLVPHSIGALYERLALDLHYHCEESEEAVDEIKRAFSDPLVPAKNRLNLEERARRILKEEWESRFSLTPPAEMVIEGETIGRDLGDERRNRFVKKDQNGDIIECSVERVALDYFLKHGMEEGLHSEGEIWHVAFKLLFWDVIYCPLVDGVWLCELQAQPLDLDHSLYEARKTAFDERFEWLRSSSENDRHSMVDKHWYGVETVTMNEIKSFITACPLETLCGVMEILVKEPRNRRSGFPDLVLWSTSKRVITVAEVKGPGDTLSSKQKLWLDFFMREKTDRVKAFLCKVTASGRKRLQ